MVASEKYVSQAPDPRLLRLTAPPSPNAAVRLVRAGTPTAIVGLRMALLVGTLKAIAVGEAALARPSLWDPRGDGLR